jgi:hypothetical protein
LNHSRGDDVALASGANRLMSKIRMSRLDRTRDAFDLVAASADGDPRKCLGWANSRWYGSDGDDHPAWRAGAPRLLAARCEFLKTPGPALNWEAVGIWRTKIETAHARDAVVRE